MVILCIETSGKICSVALGADDKVLAFKESADEKYSHAENLTLYISDVLSQAKKVFRDIDAVAVSKGPGSFTGLRIGVATAKGLCYALNKPLMAVNSLKVMARGCLNNVKQENVFYCPMMDARRMEVYCAVYDEELNEVKKTSAEIINENSFADILKTNVICFFGDGADKCKPVIRHKNARFIDGIIPSAQNMLPFAEKYFSEKNFEDIALFEPYYLKDFVSGGAR